ncbi:MAG: protein kinase [Pirellulales bacterium]|nr:protein kinase [Pirellulales bacterium]
MSQTNPGEKSLESSSQGVGPSGAGGPSGNGGSVPPTESLPPGKFSPPANPAPAEDLIPPNGSLPVDDGEKTIISNRPPLVAPGHAEMPNQGDLGEFRPGDVIGPYELIEYVGGGGMGRVFRALDTQLGRIVALKVLPQDQAGQTETLLRFRNEARSAARLDHESIARVHHVGDDRGFPYVAFEFIHGQTIRRMVEQGGPLSLVDALSYTLQIAEALAHMNQRGVIHRDIKPSNVLITPTNRAKVIDLGLAKLEEVDEAQSDLTASGVTLGTFDYISPEQARDPRHVDIRGDIYSLGCTFFYMLAGRPPFPEGTVLQKLLQHQGDDPPELAQFRSDVPEDVSAILRRMLAKDRAARYQTPDELVGHLQVLAERLGLRPSGLTSGIWAVPKPTRESFLHRHLPWIAPVAVLLCAVLVLDSLWRSPGGSTTAVMPNGQRSVPKTPETVVKNLPPATPLAGQGTDAPGPGETPSPANNGAPSPSPSSGTTTALKTPDPATAGPIESSVAPGVTSSGLGPPDVSAGLSTIDPNDTAAQLGPDVDPGGGSFDLAKLLNQGGPIEPAPMPPVLPSKLSGVLTVAESGDGVRTFASLASACAAAQPGNVIELCYNGPRVERPITLPGTKLTLRAGKGYRPVIVFRPDESDPNKYPRAMFRLSGGELHLFKVAIEMDLSRNVPADRWSLWDIGRAESVILEQCSLTIRNTFHDEAAFFNLRSAPDIEYLDEEELALSEPAAKIALVDCIVRGDATVVRSDGLQPLVFSWTNGLLATDQQLLWAAGSEMAPEPGEEIRITLKHLTALVRDGLCRLDTGRFDGYQLPVHVDCSDSILIVDPENALIDQSSVEATATGLTFSGDRNFYQGTRTFWKVDDPTFRAPSVTLDFEAWRRHWEPDHEGNSYRGRVDFTRLPDASRSVDTHTPADYSLIDSDNNWAHNAASNGGDVGLIADRLQEVAAENP